MRELLLTVDQEGLGEDWPHVEAYCQLLRAEIEERLLREEFADIEVSVRPERESVNGGRLQFVGAWDNLSEEDFLRDLTRHLQSEVYLSDKWLPPHTGLKS